MSKQFSVYVRDNENSPFKKWTENFTIWFTKSGLEHVTLWPNMQAPRYYSDISTALLRDIDPENIPDDVRCVVCAQLPDAPDGIFEGDIVADEKDVHLIKAKCGALAGRAPLVLSIFDHWEVTSEFDDPVGHILIDEIIKPREHPVSNLILHHEGPDSLSNGVVRKRGHVMNDGEVNEQAI
ncbi:MAG: hypothetical protein JRI80_00285 [Deltaproteobacteria bacterium]|nr:hypothetical protein [Deltaproteobacteria bacterium]